MDNFNFTGALIWWERQSEIKKELFKFKHFPKEQVTPSKINELYIMYTDFSVDSNTVNYNPYEDRC